VAACLFDPVNKVMGMNHFLLSHEIYKKEGTNFPTLAGRYGVQAMELLINKMYKLGAERKHIQAKAFGGATLSVFINDNNSKKSIGEMNLKFVREFLMNENIPLIAEDLGGALGRNIYFVSSDYSVYVRKHQPYKMVNLFEYEKEYQEKLKREQNQRKPDVSLWN